MIKADIVKDGKIGLTIKGNPKDIIAEASAFMVAVFDQLNSNNPMLGDIYKDIITKQVNDPNFWGWAAHTEPRRKPRVKEDFKIFALDLGSCKSVSDVERLTRNMFKDLPVAESEIAGLIKTNVAIWEKEINKNGAGQE